MIDFDSYAQGYGSGSEDLEEKIYTLIDMWAKESKYREDIASEDWVSNTLNGCIEDVKCLLSKHTDQRQRATNTVKKN